MARILNQGEELRYLVAPTRKTGPQGVRLALRAEAFATVPPGAPRREPTTVCCVALEAQQLRSVGPPAMAVARLGLVQLPFCTAIRRSFSLCSSSRQANYGRQVRPTLHQ